MQQTQAKPMGPAQNSTHMSRRPPRLSTLTQPDVPHQHAEQRPDENEIVDWVSLEGGQVDPLMVPEGVKRPGWVVQWKAATVLGSTEGGLARRMTDYYRAGFRPIPGERGKGYFFMPGEPIPPNIVIGGQMLMERPTYIEEHARKLNSEAAREQLRNKMAEVGMALPASVRNSPKHKDFISVKADPRPDLMRSPTQESGGQVPE